LFTLVAAFVLELLRASRLTCKPDKSGISNAVVDESSFVNESDSEGVPGKVVSPPGAVAGSVSPFETSSLVPSIVTLSALTPTSEALISGCYSPVSTGVFYSYSDMASTLRFSR